MFRNMYVEEIAIAVLGLLLIGVLLFLCVGVPIIHVRTEQYKCAQLDSTSIPHEWKLWLGCRVQRPNGMWTHVDDYYMIEQILGE